MNILFVQEGIFVSSNLVQNLRPPGLVIENGLNQFVHCYADAQLKILLQWISAGLVHQTHESDDLLGFFIRRYWKTAESNPNPIFDLNSYSYYHHCSPLICCTHGDRRLKRVSLILAKITYFLFIKKIFFKKKRVLFL